MVIFSNAAAYLVGVVQLCEQVMKPRGPRGPSRVTEVAVGLSSLSIRIIVMTCTFLPVKSAADALYATSLW